MSPKDKEDNLLRRIDEGVPALLLGVDVRRCDRDDVVGAQHVGKRSYSVGDTRHNLKISCTFLSVNAKFIRQTNFTDQFWATYKKIQTF